jgi:hypothetical protein
VSVSEGGQAIVGNVTQAPRETTVDKAAASPPALADSQIPAMTIAGEPAPTAVPFKAQSPQVLRLGRNRYGSAG